MVLESGLCSSVFISVLFRTDRHSTSSTASLALMALVASLALAVGAWLVFGAHLIFSKLSFVCKAISLLTALSVLEPTYGKNMGIYLRFPIICSILLSQKFKYIRVIRSYLRILEGENVLALKRIMSMTE